MGLHTHSTQQARTRELKAFMSDIRVSLVNDTALPTRVGINVEHDTYPDLTWYRGNPAASWENFLETLGSVHCILPTTLTFNRARSTPNRGPAPRSQNGHEYEKNSNSPPGPLPHDHFKGIKSLVTMRELVSALYFLKRNTTPAMGKITYAMLRNLPETHLDLLFHHINEAWDTGILPQECKGALVIPIPIPGKAPDSITNLRPISLTFGHLHREGAKGHWPHERRSAADKGPSQRMRGGFQDRGGGDSGH
ncbi:hypothetical protein HPB47_028166 [Ixodes persulcatus]|uniref:Uncharacterized protein n=1 Tax=Ixodes persulcatus TaxID=34615 RepID=A0AC60PTX6_IXOPE|nr:hypothetical protein HPB47_028166 [Ixodes persulcatus]